MSEIFLIGEKLHIVEKRMFADDVRRHFVGEVISYSDTALRMKGYAWVFNNRKGLFERKTGLRERVLILGDRILINVLPKSVNILELIYNSDNMKNYFITDGREYRLDLTEFIQI